MYRYGRYTKQIDLEAIEGLESFTGGGWREVAKEDVPKDTFSLYISKWTVGVSLSQHQSWLQQFIVPS